jgi:hypothetical protein
MVFIYSTKVGYKRSSFACLVQFGNQLTLTHRYILTESRYINKLVLKPAKQCNLRCKLAPEPEPEPAKRYV